MFFLFKIGSYSFRGHLVDVYSLFLSHPKNIGIWKHDYFKLDYMSGEPFMFHNKLYFSNLIQILCDGLTSPIFSFTLIDRPILDILNLYARTSSYLTFLILFLISITSKLWIRLVNNI